VVNGFPSQHLVRSDKSGGEAVHKPTALTKSEPKD